MRHGWRYASARICGAYCGRGYWFRYRPRYEPATGGGLGRTSISSKSGGKVRGRPPSLPLHESPANGRVVCPVRRGSAAPATSLTYSARTQAPGRGLPAAPRLPGEHDLRHLGGAGEPQRASHLEDGEALGVDVIEHQDSLAGDACRVGDHQ